MKLLKTSLYVSVVLSAGLVACSDSSTPNDVAGGVTDIGNSLAYSGQVVDASGANVASARVVAYYDSWDNVSALDSVVTMTDENGKFDNPARRAKRTSWLAHFRAEGLALKSLI